MRIVYNLFPDSPRVAEKRNRLRTRYTLVGEEVKVCCSTSSNSHIVDNEQKKLKRQSERFIHTFPFEHDFKLAFINERNVLLVENADENGGDDNPC